MSKRLILVLALAFALGITCAAYAEVQNVKVSGDLTIQGVSRDNFDLSETAYNTPTQGAATDQDEESDFLSIARVRIDADLTDNVMTTIRLINERNWDSDANQAGATDDIDIDLAYVCMKDFMNSRVSLTLGRQQLRYGNGLVIGDPDTNNLAASTALNASDLSLRKSFDAIKAVLNYDPLVVDLLYAKTDEGGVGVNDDTDLYGINANYTLNSETILEGYLFSKNRGSNDTQFTAAQRTTGVALTQLTTKPDRVHTFGMRVVNSSVNNLTAQLEGAYQFGNYNPGFDINAQDGAIPGERKAWALEAIATYDLKDVDMISKYNPLITGIYAYLSGERNSRLAGNYNGWDPMYEDQTVGHIVNRFMGFSNCQITGLNGKMKPMEDLTLSAEYYWYWLNKGYPPSEPSVAGFDTVNLRGIAGTTVYRMNSNKYLGREFDATLTYDYTEDVQFNLMGGLFMPGSAFHADNDTSATELIGSMKVTF